MPAPAYFRALLAIPALLVLTPHLAAQDSAPPHGQPAADERTKPDFVRSATNGEDGSLRLETVIRHFVNADGEGPEIWLVGAVHIADESFYSELQAFLDEKDLVLFEGVKPPGSGAENPENMSDDEKAALTNRRIRFIAVAVARYHAVRNEYPATLADLPAGLDMRLAGLVEPALKDGWGRDYEYEVQPDDAKGAGFTLSSLGADGKPGGAGVDADLHLADQKPLSKAEAGEGGPGIQAKLADALGLVFQLEAMDHNKPNWRNSDLSVDQVQAKLEAASADGSMLFGMLDGSSFSARMLSMFMGMIKGNPQMAAQMKLMLIEMLAMADDGLLERIPDENMARVMKVILEDRNEVVTDDLKGLIADPEWRGKSVAVIYGAGHLAHLQHVLTTDLGYTPAPDGDRWVSAFSVNLTKAGISPQQADQMRQMLRRMLERQTERTRARSKPEESGSGR